MESIIVSVVSMALIIASTMAVTISTFRSANEIAAAWKAMEAQSSTIRQTAISAHAPDDYGGGMLNINVHNNGHINLKDFGSWDVIVQYQSGGASYLKYSATYPPEDGQWTVNGIYVIGGDPEVFDPGMLNPGEMMVLSLIPNPEIGKGQMAKVAVTTPSGVGTQCYVTRK